MLRPIALAAALLATQRTCRARRCANPPRLSRQRRTPMKVAERSDPPRPEFRRFYYWDFFEAPLSRTDLGIDQIYLGIFFITRGGPNGSCWPAPGSYRCSD